MPRLKTKTYHFKEKNMSRTVGAKDKKPRKMPVKKRLPVVKEDSQYVYRWIRCDYFTDANKSKIAEREGWVPVTAEQQPKFKQHANSTGHIEVGGLMLCRSKNLNWERLAKNLQTALRDEINENQKRANDIDALLFKIKSLEHQVIGFQAVISYLETKSGHDTV
jgi:hypothetical protein